MKRERRRLRQKPTRAELRAMGATPGLMVQSISPDGRATVQELTPESKSSGRSARPLLGRGSLAAVRMARIQTLVKESR